MQIKWRGWHLTVTIKSNVTFTKDEYWLEVNHPNPIRAVWLAHKKINRVEEFERKQENGSSV